MHQYLPLPASALLAICVVGCNSISSTMVNRTENDQLYGNSNGKLVHKCQPRPFKGVPITMRVPTHLEVVVKETILLQPSADGKKLQQVIIPHPHFFIETALVETDKVITVDVKRPVAGMLDYKMVFGKAASGSDAADTLNPQYFSQIKSKITDQTIQQVNSALAAVLLDGKPRKSAKITSGEAGDLSSIIEENRVVAWKRFDVDSECFEQQVAEFVEQYLNRPSQPCELEVLPSPTLGMAPLKS